MARSLLRILLTFVILTLSMSIGKLAFICAVGGYSFADTIDILRHGLPMDMSMAGYFTALPAIAAIVIIWAGCAKAVRITMRVYFAIVSLLISIGILSNAALYPYWGFPLDITPVFYFVSSPAAAMASITWWQWLIAVPLMCVYAWAIYRALTAGFFRLPDRCAPGKKAPATVVAAIAALLLFIPIRGGFTVSTMNVSRAYFTTDNHLNHAAVNPLFSFMYSATHQSNFSKQFRFMEADEAASIFASLNAEKSDSLPTIASQPDIHLIILESFSSHLFPSLGGEPIATRLDSLSREGWMFGNIYSSSFRTDRALPAILNGYPAQPKTSIMKYVDKIETLPSLANSLKQAGYDTRYVYGGDVNFTNMNALLRAGGYDMVVKDTDFDISQRLSKWGAHDNVLFSRAWQLAQRRDEKPVLTVIQTSSSHEPFEVPFQSEAADPRINAFMFADSCAAAYIDSLKTLPSYSNTLIVVVPDHYGAYPELTDPQQRHRVPLMMLGGALDQIDLNPELLDKIGSQTDIAATLLGMLGIDHSQFAFSNNLLDARRRPYAFFSEPSWAMMVESDGSALLSTDTKQIDQSDNTDVDEHLKAYLQFLYSDFDQR